MTESPAIAVIIAAYNAQETVGVAVASALAEPEAAEVIVVDDCSTDQTLKAAQSAAGNDARFKALRQDTNQGPSAARNRAIADSSAPYIAVLDADDWILPGRFKSIFSKADWDFCADNIVFLGDRSELPEIVGGRPLAERHGFLDFQGFVSGNVTSWRSKRSELGFLKPVMRREFLTHHALRYAEDCRLGEDFLLYAAALGKGARFKLIENCGYAALERKNSLSAKHGIRELSALAERSKGLLASLQLDPAERHALDGHMRSIREKIVHRRVLDIRRRDGLLAALGRLIVSPTAVRDILRDRLFDDEGDKRVPRVLISDSQFSRLLQ